MVLEVAALQVRAGQAGEFEDTFKKAQSILSSMKGYVSHELQRSVEIENRYLLLVRWKTIEDHTEGFRGSPQFPEWRRLLHDFYDPAPTINHYERVTGS